MMDNGYTMTRMETVCFIDEMIGILTYSNGGKYNGEWKDGKRDGKGKFFKMN